MTVACTHNELIGYYFIASDIYIPFDSTPKAIPIMSTNTIPSIADDVTNLLVFKPPKKTLEDAINDDSLTLTDLEDDDSDDEDYDNRKPKVLVGDIILFFDGQHHGRMENLSYSQIVSIKTNDDGDDSDGDDSDADIRLSTNANFHNINQTYPPNTTPPQYLCMILLYIILYHNNRRILLDVFYHHPPIHYYTT